MNGKQVQVSRDVIRHANKRRLVRAYQEGGAHDDTIFEASTEGRKAALGLIDRLQGEEDIHRIEIYELATELESTRAWVAVHHLAEEPDAGAISEKPMLEPEENAHE